MTSISWGIKGPCRSSYLITIFRGTSCRVVPKQMTNNYQEHSSREGSNSLFSETSLPSEEIWKHGGQRNPSSVLLGRSLGDGGPALARGEIKHWGWKRRVVLTERFLEDQNPEDFLCSLFQSRNHPFQSRQADRNSTLILADGPIHFRIWILSKIVLIFLSRAVTARWLEYSTHRFDTLWLLYIILLIHGTPSFNQGVIKH